MARKRTWGRALGVAVALGLFTVACGSDDAASTSTGATGTDAGSEATDATDATDAGSEATTPVDGSVVATSEADGTQPSDEGEAVSGGTLTIATFAELGSTLDPIVVRGVTASGMYHAFSVYGALAIFDQETSTVQPFMAESVETTDEGTTWVVTIKDGITFTDGTPYDAEAVKFNWDRIADPANASANASAVTSMVSYTVTDPLTITVVLKGINTQWPTVLATNLSFIGSPTAIASMGDQFGNTPVGAGPFILESWVRDSQMTYKKNPDYFDSPRPYVDELILKPTPDINQRLSAIQSDGDVDITPGSPSAAANEPTGAVDYTVSQLANATHLNTNMAPTDDIRVRKALAMAFNAEQMAAAAYPDYPPATEFFIDGTSFYNPDIKGYDYDLEGAQKLIDEYVEDTGNEVELRYSLLSGNAQSQQVAEILQAQWQQLDHVTLEIESMAYPAYVAAYRGGEMMILTFAISGIWPEPEVFDRLYSTGLSNSFKYNNADVDAALDAFRSTLDPAEQQQAMDDFQRAILDDAKVIPTANDKIHVLARQRVHGMKFFGDQAIRTDLLWLDPS
jgi:peptide/nickel transport system substrate-binding protein